MKIFFLMLIFSSLTNAEEGEATRGKVLVPIKKVIYPEGLDPNSMGQLYSGLKDSYTEWKRANGEELSAREKVLFKKQLSIANPNNNLDPYGGVQGNHSPQDENWEYLQIKYEEAIGQVVSADRKARAALFLRGYSKSDVQLAEKKTKGQTLTKEENAKLAALDHNREFINEVGSEAISKLTLGEKLTEGDLWDLNALRDLVNPNFLNPEKNKKSELAISFCQPDPSEKECSTPDGRVYKLYSGTNNLERHTNVNKKDQQQKKKVDSSSTSK